MANQVYPITVEELKDLNTKFTFHSVHGDQAGRYETMRCKAKELARQFLEFCPPGRERALAMTNLQQAVMWANASIAVGEASDV